LINPLILIVEDNDNVRKSLREWLEGALPKYQFIEAASGEEAIDITQARAPCAIIMDISLPGMSGIEATRYIKGNMPTTQVVILTIHEEEAFFEGHVAGFDFLGGVPGNIWYDNLSLAVKKLLKGKGHRVEEQESFIAFRSHYLFQSLFCNPGEAHEKGLVENLVGYARRNFLVPLPKVSSFQELNQLLMERCLREDGRRLRGKTRTIGELWQEERARLLPLPEHAYPCCKICTVKPNSLSLVNFQTNRYSIPVNVAEEKLTLKAFVDRVEISAREKVVAIHHRSYAHHEDILDPLHYLPLLRQRISAFPYSATGTGQKSSTITWLPCASVTRMEQLPGSLSKPWSSVVAILRRKWPRRWTRL